MIISIYERGVPAMQAEAIADVQTWFATHSRTGEVPDERSIRRRVTPIRKALREPA